MSVSSLVRLCSRLSRPSQLSVCWRRYGSIAEATSVKLESASGGLTVGGSSYHPAWLRHNCQCPECWDTGTCMKIIDHFDISTRNTIKNVTIADGRLDITWSSGHRGYIELDWLDKVAQPKVDNSTPPIATEVPVLDGSDLVGNKERLWQWLYNINEYGVCILTNMGTAKSTIVELTKTMYIIQPTFNGATFDVPTVDNPNSNKLNFHMDQQYYQSPPGLLMLHCLEFDDCVTGGKSVIVDMFGLVEILRDKYPEHFNTLSRVPVTFERAHYKRDKPVDIRAQYPHIGLDSENKVVDLRWTPSSEGTLDVPEADVGAYYEAYERLNWLMYNNDITLYHRLKPGEILTFNNRRFLNSGTEFELNGGRRFLHGAYVNIDHVRSTFAVLNAELGKNAKVRRFFNGNSF